MLACSGTLSPLRHQLEPGQDAYLIVVGDGPTGPEGELYAAAPVDSGDVIPVTFSPVAEMDPRLSPDGTVIAFLRAGGTPADSAKRWAWLLNLINGAERRLELPDSAGTPRAVGWAPDGRAVYLATDRGRWRVPAPPAHGSAEPVSPADSARADSALAVLLGNPAFAEVVPCDSGLCVRVATGETQPLAAGAHDATPWGADSVAYIVGNTVEIRPLGPGHVRTIRWYPPVGHLRGLTYFGGR